MCEVRDLKPNGANILVTEENKKEYVHLVCQMKMTGEIMLIHCLIPNQQQTVTDFMLKKRSTGKTQGGSIDTF